MSEAALSPRLLRFLATVVGARRIAAIGAGEENPHLQALRQAGPGLEVVRLDEAELGQISGSEAEPTSRSESLSQFELFYLAPGATLERPPGHALVVAAEPDALPEAGFGSGAQEVGWAGVRIARGPATGAPRFALAMRGTLDPRASAELASITEASHLDRPTAPLPDDAGRLLWLLTRARRTRRAWELGGGVGASTIWLAAGLRRPGGRMASAERDSGRQRRARGHLERAGLLGRVDLRLGDTARLLPDLPGSPALVLLDHDPRDRADDLVALLPRCAPGALVSAHGMHVEPSEHARYRALVATRPEIVAEHTLAVGGGLSLALLG